MGIKITSAAKRERKKEKKRTKSNFKFVCIVCVCERAMVAPHMPKNAWRKTFKHNGSWIRMKMAKLENILKQTTTTTTAHRIPRKKNVSSFFECRLLLVLLLLLLYFVVCTLYKCLFASRRILFFYIYPFVNWIKLWTIYHVERVCAVHEMRI